MSSVPLRRFVAAELTAGGEPTCHDSRIVYLPPVGKSVLPRRSRRAVGKQEKRGIKWFELYADV